ncbi:MAG TPA: hypothetical protein PLD10_14190 [Rhodopila sp.]|nr:hypothetical protein [Rhodopila sp.]
MAANAHGYAAQDEFASKWGKLGKRGWSHRFEDASDLFGRNKKLVQTGTQPADFLCGYSGWLGLVECKATIDPKGFKVSLIRQSQMISATLSVAAKTNYVFCIKQQVTGNWFFAPAEFVINQKGTITWGELFPYLWPENQLCPNLPT